jgi:acetyl-CoA synthetase
MMTEEMEKYDLSSLKHCTIAGEALNPEVYQQWLKRTGIEMRESFGQTELCVAVGTFPWMKVSPGSMGKPSPMFDMDIIDEEGNSCPPGVVGEMVIRTRRGKPIGMFAGYYRDEERTQNVWHDGLYHTGDLAWRDEEGYYWYVGRADDVIKSSGYRIGPFEIESTIMELPYVLECGVCAAPDEVRGQVVRACVVLVDGVEENDELRREIQNYVKQHTAPYKYPRIVEFRKELPKTISGKIIRNKL